LEAAQLSGWKTVARGAVDPRWLLAIVVLTLTVPPVAVSAQGCSPRPPVRLTTQPSSGPKLQASVTAGAGNLTSLAFVGIPTTGTAAYTVEIGGQTKTPPFTYPPPSPPPVVTFTVVRLGDGGPLTVPFVATDGCGPWRTFVGAGTAALTPIEWAP